MLLRPYQEEALRVLNAYWDAGGGNPLVAMATATGKSVLLAKLICDIAERYPPFRALVLVHVRELLQQNLKHLFRLWPAAPVGINSAGLQRRDWDAPIIFANIQSVWRSPQRLGRRDLLLADECHLIPHAGTGMWRATIEALRQFEPAMRVCGLSATPFRLDSGRLDQGEGKIFDDVVFEYDIARGIRDGYLSPLTSKATQATIDVRGVGRRGGEFIAAELEQAADDSAIVAGAADEIVERGRDRRSWLMFCCGVSHARHVCDALRERGVSVEMIAGTTPDAERDRIIAAFHRGDITALTNVNLLTTGFDVPQVDLLAMLRPTLSTGLYIQMIGRGTRLAENKRDCLILDFAGNVWRHGPVDHVDISVNGKENHSGSVKVDAVSARRCPDCGELVALADYVCPSCSHEFPRPRPHAKHASRADVVPILAGTMQWLSVSDVSFHRHVKWNDPSAPPSLRVEYLCGLSVHCEYLSLERHGYPREMAERWWFAMGGVAPTPASVEAALMRSDEIDVITHIVVTRSGKFWNVVERRVRRPDGSLVEINRNHHCYTAHSREAAAVLPISINDEIPY
jgi:DNA repair protein RadD